MSFRGYSEVTGEDRSQLGAQVASQRARVLERLQKIRHVVAVTSGKGGVGKSYVAARLALGAAQRLSGGVGVLDADLKSPTVARMLGAGGPLVVGEDGRRGVPRGAPVKFLCIDCDQQMEFEQRQVPGDGTFGAAFRCPRCGRRIAMLANPMETQLVQALGVKVGGRTIDEQPLELVRNLMQGKDDAFAEDRGLRTLAWSPDARARLERVPNFVRGMVKKIYAEYVAERGIAEITPAVMDQARQDLGLEGM